MKRMSFGASRRGAMMLTGLAGLAALLAGCSSKGPCKKACDKIAECMGIDLYHDGSPGSTWTCPLSEACSPEESCRAGCIDQASCPAILGEDPAAEQELLGCQSECHSASPPDGGQKDSGPLVQDGFHRLHPVDSGGDRGRPPREDGASLPDRGTPPRPDSGPAHSGAVIISELMPNPAVVPDSDGEYFELYNADSVTIDLQGFRSGSLNVQLSEEQKRRSMEQG